MQTLTRRELLSGTAAALASVTPSRLIAVPAPKPVAVARCATYSPALLLSTLNTLFDRLGGLGRLVKGKTVAVKINLTGEPALRLGYLPAGYTHYTHPAVAAATVHLIGKAGARRIRVIEGGWSSAPERLEEVLLLANHEPRDILGAAPDVEFENTNYAGKPAKYSRLRCPSGGYIFPAYDLNHSYEDCDVFVSLAKMKEHAIAGITLSMKNCFGITPCTIYGEGAGEDEPSEFPSGGRNSIVHSGRRQPPKSAPQEKDPSTPRDAGYRVPRVVADLVSARPIDLAIVEAVHTMTGGEGPWNFGGVAPASPGFIVAGLNPVNTDAVCMSTMGFDPMAEKPLPPFETGDNTLRLAEDAGVGTRDLKQIEIIGASAGEVLFDFASIRRKRRAKMPAEEFRRRRTQGS